MRRRGEARDILYRVLATLYRYADSIAVIEHPRSIKMRSIDIAVKLRDGRRLIVKVAYDLEDIPKSEIRELLSLASLLDLSPLIIAAEKGGEPLLDGVAYEKGGVRAVTVGTLENVLSGEELVFIRVEKSHFTVSIDGETLRKRRTELNLSLGDLAAMLGVSRRTVYEYERGGMEPTLEKAEILIKILGEDIAKPIDLFSPAKRLKHKENVFDTIVEEKLARKLREIGYKIVHVKRTTFDIAARKGEREMAIVVEHPSRSASLLDKVYYLNKLANTVGISERYVIVETPRVEKILEKEGYEALKPEDFIELVGQENESFTPDGTSRKREDYPR